jgi:hypothetical protein
MKTIRSHALAGSLGVTLAFLLMLAAGLLLTGSEAVAEGGSEGATAGEAAPGQAGDQVEGIKVHGHWTIEVRDPDGSLVERREFDNALASTGGNMMLTSILGRDKTVGNWQVWTRSQIASEVCEEPAGTPDIQCHIVEAGDPSAVGQNKFFETLVVSLPAGPPYSLNLSGSLTAQRDGSIERVNTVLYFCGSAVASDACVGTGTSSGWITDTLLPSPVAVLTGQQVLVNVVISFS